MQKCLANKDLSQIKLLCSYSFVFPYSQKLSGSELSMPRGAPDKIKKANAAFYTKGLENTLIFPDRLKQHCT